MKYKLCADENLMLKTHSNPTHIDWRRLRAYGCALSLTLQRIRTRMSPAWNSKSVSVFDSLGFRRFTSEPGENCPPVDEDFIKYNCFSAKSIDI